jgi:hypothetical protein
MRQRFSQIYRRCFNGVIESARGRRRAPEPLSADNQSLAPETKLLQLLRDPLIVCMMQADNVTESDLIELFEQIARARQACRDKS